MQDGKTIPLSTERGIRPILHEGRGNGGRKKKIGPLKKKGGIESVPDWSWEDLREKKKFQGKKNRICAVEQPMAGGVHGNGAQEKKKDKRLKQKGEIYIIVQGGKAEKDSRFGNATAG